MTTATIAPDSTKKPAQPNELFSTRTAYMQAENLWGGTLKSITIRHLRSNDVTKMEEATFTNLTSGATSSTVQITYETGFGADRDCWFVTFVTEANETWSSKEDFRCNLTADDADGTVNLVVNIQGESFNVNPPQSSGCRTSMHKR